MRLFLEEAPADTGICVAQKFVDYENELRVLREQLRQQHERHSSTTSNKSDPDHHAPTPAAASVERPGISRFGSFMRKASLATNDGVRDQVLEAALVKEQTARIAAETKIRQMSAEVEDLSTTLFQQANEMVATERRENALLREKIRELEGASGQGDEGIAKENERLIQKLHALEQRDAARVQRLERLEAAQNRIDRVRTMLEQR